MKEKGVAIIFLIFGILGLVMLYNVIVKKRYYHWEDYSKVQVIFGNVLLSLFIGILLLGGIGSISFLTSKK